MVDVKGYIVDAKGYMVAVKGYNMDAKGYMVDVKGYSVDAKGYTVVQRQDETQHSRDSGRQIRVQEPKDPDGASSNNGRGRGRRRDKHNYVRVAPRYTINPFVVRVSTFEQRTLRTVDLRARVHLSHGGALVRSSTFRVASVNRTVDLSQG